MASYYRQSAIEKARHIWQNQPVFLDTETTGLSSGSEIVEISIIDHDGAVLLDTLVRPLQSIPVDVINIHGITDEMVSSAPTWLHIWPKVESLIQGRSVGIYNAEFDLRMMKQSHQRIGLPWRMPSSHIFCIMKLYADFSGDRKWQKLEIAGKRCGLSLPNTHRAKDDTLLARAVFRCMLAGDYAAGM